MLRIAVVGCLFAVAYGKSLEDASRIVGGSEIEITQAPYQLALLRDYWGVGVWGFQCGAALISESRALTSAHCTLGGYRLRVRAGSNNHQTGGIAPMLSAVINHPEYDHFTLANDICVLKFAEPVELNSSIQPIALAELNYYPENGATAYVSGWGTTVAIDGTTVSTLRGASIPIISLHICNLLYSDHYMVVQPDMLCAGVVNGGGVAPCNGDSGGPLVVDNVLVGLVSWSESCALADKPTVFANVGYFRQWIAQVAEV